MNIPNWLTTIRMIMIPIFVIIFYLPFKHANLVAAVVFAFAASTDWLDGYLARKLKQMSSFGAFLDPVADKLMVAVALVLICSNPLLPYMAIPVAVIVGREIAVSSLREWMAELGKRAKVSVSYIGKLKTVIQMVAIVILIAANPLNENWFLLSGYVTLYLSAVLTLWSMSVYLIAAWPDFDFK